jgi:hypothetical protein
MDTDDRTDSPYQRLRASKESIGYKSEPGDLAFVNDAEDALLRAFIRVQALVFAVSHAMFHGAGLPGGPDDADIQRQLRGEFTLLPEGGWRVDGPDDQV